MSGQSVSFNLISRHGLPPSLDGRYGTNRRHDSTLLSADNDIAAITAWLDRFKRSVKTYQNYRKEAERLLLWSLRERLKPVSSLTHEDITTYLAFIRNPEPRKRWVSTRKYPRTNPSWRPFAGPLSESSVRQAETILNAMFSWLVKAGYIVGNPMGIAMDRRNGSGQAVQRYLSLEAWKYLAKASMRGPRERMLVALFYLTGLRISELVNLKVSDFFREQHDSRIRWFIRVVGKGRKERIVPASNELMHEFSMYMKSIGRPPSPVPGDSRPVIADRRRTEKPIVRMTAHAAMKSLLDYAASMAGNDGDLESSAQLSAASAHWMRHTAGTHMVISGVPVEVVREIFGHESIGTTSRYVHTGRRRMHDAVEASYRANIVILSEN